MRSSLLALLALALCVALVSAETTGVVLKDSLDASEREEVEERVNNTPLSTGMQRPPSHSRTTLTLSCCVC